MLKIKEILIKIILFKINYNNLVDFQKNYRGYNPDPNIIIKKTEVSQEIGN
jgi:hypothetical protein